MSTRRKTAVVSFWTGEACEYCGGPIRDRTVAITRKFRGKMVLFQGVPVGICKDCGNRYLAANVLKLMTERLHRAAAPDRHIEVPVYQFQEQVRSK